MYLYYISISCSSWVWNNAFNLHKPTKKHVVIHTNKHTSMIKPCNQSNLKWACFHTYENVPPKEQFPRSRKGSLPNVYILPLSLFFGFIHLNRFIFVPFAVTFVRSVYISIVLVQFPIWTGCPRQCGWTDCEISEDIHFAKVSHLYNFVLGLYIHRAPHLDFRIF